MPLFQKLMSPDKRYRYWIRYLQIPATRSPDAVKLPGYSKDKFAEFWRYANFLENLLSKLMIAQGTFYGTFIVLTKYYLAYFMVLTFMVLSM